MLELKPRTLKDVQNSVRPLTYVELIPKVFPAKGETTKNYTLINGTPPRNEVIDQSEEITGHDNNDWNQVDDEQHITSGGQTIQGTADSIHCELETNLIQDENIKVEEASEDTEDEPISSESETIKTGTGNERHQPGDQQYFIDLILNPGKTIMETTAKTNLGQTIYRVCWYGNTSQYGTWEPIEHLPRSKVMIYYHVSSLN